LAVPIRLSEPNDPCVGAIPAMQAIRKRLARMKKWQGRIPVDDACSLLPASINSENDETAAMPAAVSRLAPAEQR